MQLQFEGRSGGEYSWDLLLEDLREFVSEGLGDWFKCFQGLVSHGNILGLVELPMSQVVHVGLMLRASEWAQRPHYYIERYFMESNKHSRFMVMAQEYLDSYLYDQKDKQANVKFSPPTQPSPLKTIYQN